MFSGVYKDILYGCGYYNLRKTQSHLKGAISFYENNFE